MQCHCGTNNRAPRWTFTYPCKPEVRPGAREESASPAWLAAPAMNACDTTKVYTWRLDNGCGRHYIGSVTATTHQEKGIITLESNHSLRLKSETTRQNINICILFMLCSGEGYISTTRPVSDTHTHRGGNKRPRGMVPDISVSEWAQKGEHQEVEGEKRGWLLWLQR